MLRIALQSKGRLNEESMALLHEAGIKPDKRLLLVPAKTFRLKYFFCGMTTYPKP